jgi:nitroreductase
MKNLLEKLNWRYAVKKYDPVRKVSAEDIRLLQEAVRLAPSSFGLQPYRVLFIENTELREKLKVASFLQPQVTDASFLVVIAIESNLGEALVNQYFERMSQTRDIPMEGNLLKHRESVLKSVTQKSAEENRQWATHQAYLALGFLLLTAAELKVDANAMEGFIPDQYDNEKTNRYRRKNINYYSSPMVCRRFLYIRLEPYSYL